MARLLLVPVAVVALIAGLLGLVLALAGVMNGVAGAASGAALGPARGPALGADLCDAALGAALVLALAALPGLAAALAFRRAGKTVRYTAAGLALLLLLAPAPGFVAAPFLHGPWSGPALLGLLAAAARAAALIMLVLLAGLRVVPPHLQRAAMLAGARPGQAWRHAVLAPLWPYFLAGIVAAFALTLAGPLAAAWAPPLAMANSWAVPACLLLAGAGLAGLFALLLTRREA